MRTYRRQSKSQFLSMPDFAALQSWLFSRQRRPHHKSPQGFSESAAVGLADLEARMPPPGVATVPAYAPSHRTTSRLSPEAAAGGGLVADADGNVRPHYWGHRERLRKRLLLGGHSSMPDYEVLELLLFNAIPRIDVKPLAKRLLAAFNDLSGVIAASEQRLLEVPGANERVFVQLRIAEAFAVRLAQTKVMNREVISSWSALIEYCRTAMVHRPTEQFRVLYLDRGNVLVADEEQAIGTVDHVPVYPREVAKRCLELNASAIVLVHNHPSGDPTPSQDDIHMTSQVIRACDAIGVSVHDHVIVGQAGEVSFRAQGLLH
ncbi:MAG: DNA repair protein RadC [Pseudomonadota bacterium]